MRAIVLERYGPPDLLALKDVPTPTPGAGEVLVRVHAASVNDWDWAMMRGDTLVNRFLSGLFRPKIPVLGCDLAGRVEAVGEGVRGLRPGDEVHGDLCMHGFGAFAEYARAPETALVKKHPGMSFEEAASLPQAGMLAVQALVDTGRIGHGRRILLNGAGGGVGTIAIQLAKLLDVEVTAVDAAGKLEMLKGMGADRVVDYRETDFTREGRRYDLILDVKTNRSPFAYLRALERDGTYATVGGSIPRLFQTMVVGPPLSRLARKHLRVVMLKPNKDLPYLNGLFEAGKLVPVIDRTYPLAETPEALRYFGTADHKGKIVITV